MNIAKFLSDEQDVKTVEKVVSKLIDLLTSDEELIYIAVQKKPAVNLLPDSIAISSNRIFYCEPSNLGLTMNFKDISWKNIKEVSFKEEFFGSKFICVPQHGENLVTEFIPKIQARKLHQAATEYLGKVANITIPSIEIEDAPRVDEPMVVATDNEDETTLKLRKLKALYDKQLITLEEYENKKANILATF